MNSQTRMQTKPGQDAEVQGSAVMNGGACFRTQRRLADKNNN